MSNSLCIYFLYGRCVASFAGKEIFRAPLNLSAENEEIFTQLRRCLGQTYNTHFFYSIISPLLSEKIQFTENQDNEVVFAFDFINKHKNLTPDFLIMTELFKINEILKEETITKVYLCIPSHFHQEKRIRLKVCCERIFKTASAMLVNSPVALALGLQCDKEEQGIEIQDLYILLNENGIDVNVVKINHNEKVAKQLFSFGTCKLSIYDAIIDIAKYISSTHKISQFKLLELMLSVKNAITDMTMSGNCEILFQKKTIFLSQAQMKSICEPFFGKVNAFLQQHQSRIPRYNRVHFFGSGLLLPHLKSTISNALALSDTKIDTIEPNCVQMIMKGCNQTFSYIPCLPYSIFKLESSTKQPINSQLGLIFRSSSLNVNCQFSRFYCYPDIRGQVSIYEGLTDNLEKNAKMVTLSINETQSILEFTVDSSGIVLIKNVKLGTFIPCVYHSDNQFGYYSTIMKTWCDTVYKNDTSQNQTVKRPFLPERFYLLKDKKQVDFQQISKFDPNELSILTLDKSAVTIYPLDSFNRMIFDGPRVQLFESTQKEPTLILNFEQAASFFKMFSNYINTQICLSNLEQIKALIQNGVHFHSFQFNDKFKITISNGDHSYDLC